MRVNRDGDSKVYLVRGPGAAEKSGKVTLQTDKGAVEATCARDRQAVEQRLRRPQKQAIYGGAAIGTAGGRSLGLITLPRDRLQQSRLVADRRDLLPALDALVGAYVFSPVLRGTTPDATISRLANTTIDGHLADGGESLKVRDQAAECGRKVTSHAVA